MRRLLVALLGTVLLSACGGAQAATAQSLPSRILPSALDGLQVQESTSVRDRFAVQDSLVLQGRLYTMQLDAAVEATMQIALLNPDVDTTDVDQEQSIRQEVGSGAFRYYRSEGQWVGEQDTPDDRVFLWYPDASPGVFEVLIVANEMGHPQDLLAAVIRYQKGAS